jgi:mannosyltransferase OCH1-like enzyme
MDKIIHQIWVGDNPMPVQDRYYTRDMRLKNPTWEYKLWKNDNLPELPENIQKTFDMFGKDKQYALQADVLRLFLIKEYGGLYIDVDFEPLNSFDDFQDNIFCKWNDLILNGVFGAFPNNKIFVDLCDQIKPEITWYGPSWFTKALAPYNINIISLEEFEQKYAKHHAMHSWGSKPNR